jgi:putative two-component system response regulator
MKQILIVDDNLMSLQQISAFIEDAYDTVLAKSGEQALKICVKKIPDLIILDVEMPEMNGFEVMDQLKKNLLLSRIPVIFLTANRDSSTEVRALESGAVDFIVKPAEREILLHRIGLHLKLSDYQRYLENTVRDLEDNIVTAFSDMIEYRDESTGGHVTRTAKYVEMICRELTAAGDFPDELNEKAIELITRAAPLHDVGKIGISDIILLKPAMLNDEEFAIIKTHTTIGADLLRSMYQRTPQAYLEYGIMIALSHHERVDGKGYPQGLKGDAIPLCARIMAVSDVYDALVDTRVYKRPMTHADACRIIYAGMGTQFDSKVVKAFQNVQHMFAELTKNRLG